MKKITLEYDVKLLTSDKRVKSNQNGKSYHYKKIRLHKPKAWEVIAVENCMSVRPGQHLNEIQVKQLCDNKQYDVVIGNKGQFRIGDSRY